ncbi:MAG: 50S ribosomal protein L29 [Desulfobacteraceae bacterium]
MKTAELRKMSADEIEKKLLDLKKELFNLRFQHGTAQLENTAALSKVRKDIARVKTVARELDINLT